MPKVHLKIANLATLQNFDVIEKMDAGFGISDLKLIKFHLFQTKHIFSVDHCYYTRNKNKGGRLF